MGLLEKPASDDKQKKEGFDPWRAYDCYCPNCNARLTGYRDAEGAIKISCFRCGARIVRRFMGRRHDRFEVYAPSNQVRDCEDGGLPFL